jgi:polar amino acid transport system substrate-binding protein
MRIHRAATLLFLALSHRALAQQPPTTTLKVGVAGSAPFVVRNGDAVDGIAVQVWRQVATRAGLGFDLLPQPNVATSLAKVATGELDVAVGPISITAERAEKVSFTQPYFHSSLAIAAPSGGKSTWQRVKPFLSKTFLVGLATLIVVLCIVGFLVWLAERRRNPDQFPRHPIRGVGNGMWLAIVTMTTVGYGDRAPMTVAGRLIVATWMLIALIATSSLTAGIASVLTVQQLEGGTIERAEQLAGVRTAAVGGTTGERFARQHGARIIAAADLPAAVALVAKKQADAVVFDRPQLRYSLLHNPDVALTLSALSYEPQGYGFATARGSALGHQLSVALLATLESGAVESLTKDWLGEEP